MFATVNVSLMSESLRWLKTVITLQGPWFVRRVFLRWACDNRVTLLMHDRIVTVKFKFPIHGKLESAITNAKWLNAL
jgi:hypothetical protein